MISLPLTWLPSWSTKYRFKDYKQMEISIINKAVIITIVGTCHIMSDEKIIGQGNEIVHRLDLSIHHFKHFWWNIVLNHVSPIMLTSFINLNTHGPHFHISMRYPHFEWFLSKGSFRVSIDSFIPCSSSVQWRQGVTQWLPLIKS